MPGGRPFAPRMRGITANAGAADAGSSSSGERTPTCSYTGDRTPWSGRESTRPPFVKDIPVKSLDRNKTIAAGGNVTTSAGSHRAGTPTAPTSFSVNGTVCGGAHRPPRTVPAVPTVPTVPTARTVPTGGAAGAGHAAVDAKVAEVEFHSSGTPRAAGSTTASRRSPRHAPPRPARCRHFGARADVGGEGAYALLIDS